MQIKIGSQRNRLDVRVREIKSIDESIFCTEKSDIEVIYQELKMHPLTKTRKGVRTDNP